MTKRSPWPWIAALGAAVLVLAPGALSGAPESHAFTYKVTITNLTRSQPMTPPLVATHPGSGYLFAVGAAASPGLQQIAENGNLNRMQFRLQNDRVANRNTDYTIAISSAAPPGPLVPSNLPAGAAFPASTTFAITARPGDSLSFAAMLICTNDGFTGVDGLELPREMGGVVSIDTIAYDAGTELDTERFADLVPPCQALSGVSGAPGTTTSNPALAEHGVVHPHEGIQGGHDLDPAKFGWKEPVARITVERVG